VYEPGGATCEIDDFDHVDADVGAGDAACGGALVTACTAGNRFVPAGLGPPAADQYCGGVVSERLGDREAGAVTAARDESLRPASLRSISEVWRAPERGVAARLLARLVAVQDALFAEPRLAGIYDVWEGDRVDLPNYLAIVAELGARSVLDVGCGTGNWACMLAERGFEVVGLDLAAASLDVAKGKPGAQRVRWVHGDVTSLPALAVDLATMTGNVSNVFLTEQEWSATLRGVHAALRPGGHLVFESVDPAGQPWLNWNRETTYVRRESPDAGAFESWMDVTQVDGDLVSTRRTYVFAADGATLTSEGTRRYPSRVVIERSLSSAGYEVTDIRDAPERPGLELVFIARKPVATS
jgi:SAM-dependent methyltransferase